VSAIALASEAPRPSTSQTLGSDEGEREDAGGGGFGEFGGGAVCRGRKRRKGNGGGSEGTRASGVFEPPLHLHHRKSVLEFTCGFNSLAG